MKLLGLDLGDQWTGIAISDSLGMFARPYQTIASSELDVELEALFKKENITSVVVGIPTTMKGGVSEQTQKVLDRKKLLEARFPNYTWAGWDERLSSKQAEKLRHAKTREEKLQSHALAAAFILQSYLDYQSTLRQSAL